MNGPGFLPPPTQTAQATRASVENAIGATVVGAPATGVVDNAGTPGLGYMPAPGHFTMPTLVVARMTSYIFAR